MFFDGWTGLVRIVAVALIAVAALLVLQCLERRRSVSSMTALDFVVLVGLGSSLSATLLFSAVTLVGVALAAAILLGARSLVRWAEARFGGIRVLQRGEPVLVAWRGTLLRSVMRRQRIGEAEVLTAARVKGVASVCDIETAILETTGSIRIVPRYRSSAARRYIGPPNVRLYRDERDR